MILKIDKINQKIKIVNTNKYLSRDVSVIIGTVVSGMNKKNQIILKDVKIGVVIDKVSLNIKYANFKEKELTIELNEENIMPLKKNDGIRMEFIIVKQNDVGKDNYEKTYKKATFKIIKSKEKE